MPHFVKFSTDYIPLFSSFSMGLHSFDICIKLNKIGIGRESVLTRCVLSIQENHYSRRFFNIKMLSMIQLFYHAINNQVKQ